MFELTATSVDGSATDTIEIDVSPAVESPEEWAAVPTFTAGQAVAIEAPQAEMANSETVVKWQQVKGVPIALSGEDTLAPRFDAPDVFVTEELEFEVSMTNGNETVVDRVRIRIDPVAVVAREDASMVGWSSVDLGGEEDKGEEPQARGIGRVWAALLSILPLRGMRSGRRNSPNE